MDIKEKRKENHRRESREYYQRNRKKVIIYQKKYRKKNKDKVLEEKKEYYQRKKKEILAYKKEYRQRPGYKEKFKQYMKEYSKKPEVIEKKRKRDRERLRLKRQNQDHKELERKRERSLDYRATKNHYMRTRKKTDPQYAIGIRLRQLVLNALKKYSKEGKIWRASKYGINYPAIIERLKPFPEDISKYHIDHIKPLCTFDLNDSNEIKRAFAPENHQWLLAEENLRKNRF